MFDRSIYLHTMPFFSKKTKKSPLKWCGWCKNKISKHDTIESYDKMRNVMTFVQVELLPPTRVSWPPYKKKWQKYLLFKWRGKGWKGKILRLRRDAFSMSANSLAVVRRVMPLDRKTTLRRWRSILLVHWCWQPWCNFFVTLSMLELESSR